jgi:hypothetical protein
MNRLAAKLKSVLDEPENRITLIFSAAIFVLGFLMLSRYIPFGDDVVYREEFPVYYSTYGTIMGPFAYAWYRAKSWQPRLISEILLMAFNLNMAAYKIFGATTLALTFWLTSRIASMWFRFDHRRTIQLIIAGGIFLIDPHVLQQGFYWYSGAFNYSVPYLFMLVAVMPFVNALRSAGTRPLGNRKNTRLWKAAFYVIIGACACYTEQKSAFLIAFGLIALLYCVIRKIPVSKWLYAYYVWLFAHSAFFNVWNTLLSPRISYEKHWYPNFDSVSFAAKLFQGINLTHYQHWAQAPLLYLSASALLCLALFKKYKGAARYLGVLPLGYATLIAVKWDSLLRFNLSGVYQKFINPTLANPSNFTSEISALMPAMLGMFVTLLFGVSLLFLFDSIIIKLIATSVYAASLFSGYICALSPTIFASGPRLFHSGQFLFLIVLGMLAGEFVTHWADRPLVIRNAVIAFTAMSALCGTLIVFMMFGNMLNAN